MVESTHCTQCNAPLIEVDFYGERMVGCIDCNRWTRDGWLYTHLPEVYVKVVASLLPREVHAEITGPTHEDRVTELMERLAQLDAENAAKAAGHG